MGKVADGVRKFANKMGKSLHWPRGKPTVPKKQIDRWEDEGGSLPPEELDHR